MKIEIHSPEIEKLIKDIEKLFKSKNVNEQDCIYKKGEENIAADLEPAHSEDEFHSVDYRLVELQLPFKLTRTEVVTLFFLMKECGWIELKESELIYFLEKHVRCYKEEQRNEPIKEFEHIKAVKRLIEQIRKKEILKAPETANKITDLIHALIDKFKEMRHYLYR